LQQELQEVSKERTDESAAARARQLQSDRRMAEMSVTISRLQADSKKSSFSESRESGYSLDEGERGTQVKALSEQVLKQQETIARSRSEISALKNRLQVAVGRSDRAEEALSSVQESDDLYDRMESAPLSGSTDGGRPTMRRRGGRGSSSDAGSIRSAIALRGQKGENIGKAIDAVDSFSVQTGKSLFVALIQNRSRNLVALGISRGRCFVLGIRFSSTGKYLRANPLARAGFLLYLFLIHLWTFVLLFFHAHGFETVHGDFGAGHEVPHGPHALMQAHDPAAIANP